MFKKLEGDTALVVQNGVFKVADLYERDGKLFAQAAGGFVRLYRDGRTSKSGLAFTTLVTEEPLFKDRFDRLCLTAGHGRSALQADEAERLLLEAE
jgi:hypothetical protein